MVFNIEIGIFSSFCHWIFILPLLGLSISFPAKTSEWPLLSIHKVADSHCYSLKTSQKALLFTNSKDKKFEGLYMYSILRMKM